MKIFWSWQSDTHGKTGRHFVREALALAIQRLKESDEIEEPAEREKVDQMHLDHDRQGVSGSPDLASTIFSKIKESVVFIADVTPVAELEKIVEEKRKTKKIMNPNVAIELGYALHVLGDNSILMIMNSYYGDRDSLPFDLAHKAGPIIYHLAPDANKQQIDAQRNLLSANIAEALKPYLSAPTPQQEKLEERIKRQEKEIQAKNKKDAYIRSEQAAMAAPEKAKELLDLIERQITSLELEIKAERVNNKYLEIIHQGFGYSVTWEQPYINTLDNAKLLFTIWRGFPPRIGRVMWDEHQQITHKKYIFDCGLDLNSGWKTGTGMIRLLKNEEVSEECLRFFMDFVHQSKMQEKAIK